MKKTLRLVLAWLATCLCDLQPAECRAEDAAADIRRTAAVVAVEKVQPAIGAVYAFGKQGQGTGSGSVIDPRGYVLTAKHVTMTNHVVLLGGRPPLNAELVGTMPEFDVAILKLGGPAFSRPGAPDYPRARLPLDFVRLGVHDEVRAGESILNIGSPGGRGIVVTQGIVSAVAFTAVNPLAISLQSSTAFDELLQFDAASNPGNSGGAVVNLLGQQIGLTVSGIRNEQGIHFALPMKTVRHSIASILNSEMRHRYTSGITIDPQLATVIVTKIDEGSPASIAGIEVGDRILSVGGHELRDPIDWEFTRYEWRPGNNIALEIERDDQTLKVSIKLAERVGHKGIEVESPVAGLTCRFAPYDPQLANPLDDAFEPSGAPITINTVQAKPSNVTQEDHYELVIEGLLKIDQDGIYRMGLRSDDGSRLFIHDQLVVDNGGNHSPILRTNWVDLQAGLHPIRIEFYEDEGQQLLEFVMALGDDELVAVAPEKLFHSANE
jgi:S1-C subfamily serine protease